jgi:hypothetical protein
MTSRFGLFIEGLLVFGILVIWGALYIALNPPTQTDMTLYNSLGTHEVGR